MTRNVEAGFPSFVMHFQKLANDFGSILCLNLLSGIKDEESKLTQNYEKCLQKLSEMNNPQIKTKYTYFDFYTFCSYDNYSAIELNLLQRIAPILNYLGSFIMKQGTASPIFQSGVVRTNCLDCIDRTNVIQHSIAKHFIKFWLEGIHFDSLGENKVVNDFVNELWAENGNMLSKQYSGTKSLTAINSKKGKSSIITDIKAAVNSVKRFINNNLGDDTIKQECINILLCQKSMEEAIKTINYENLNSYLLCIITFNAGGKLSEDLNPILQNIKTKTNKIPDIIVLGLQEMVPLSVGSYIEDEIERLSDLWLKKIENEFNTLSYQICNFKRMFGLIIAVLGQKELVSKGLFGHIADGSFKTGFGKMVGNKGAISIKMSVFNSFSLCFTNCHLKAGQNNAKDRLLELKAIYEKSTVGNKLVSGGNFSEINKSDILFMFGDLNFRVDMPFSEAINMAPSITNVPFLLSNDQLSKYIGKIDLGLNKQFLEQGINFTPTYSYLEKYNTYHLKKKRVPSWCDRILWIRNEELIHPKYYGKIDNMFGSDHRPVYGIFVIGKDMPDLVINENSEKQINSEDNIQYTSNFVLQHNNIILKNSIGYGEEMKQPFHETPNLPENTKRNSAKKSTVILDFENMNLGNQRSNPMKTNQKAYNPSKQNFDKMQEVNKQTYSTTYTNSPATNQNVKKRAVLLEFE